jgi:hypothetical protein
MRLPRFRVRTLMLLVVLVAVPLTLLDRRARFLGLANRHEGLIGPPPGPYAKSASPRSGWHWELSNKYRRAAERPWLPVEPDPPPPPE